jgi:glycine/D-amino acid oxidase-like deaminating enzyme
MNRSLWRNQGSITARDCVKAANSFDVAIIGGGFSGLWSAYHLKQLQPSLKIAIFEQKYVGYGASGRNGGWASAEYPTSNSRLLKEHGVQTYKNLRKSLIESIDEIGQIAKSNAWQIEYAKGGALVFATNKAQLTRISSEIDDEHKFLTKDQASELLNVANIKGGIYTPHCAALNPFNLTQSLAKYLESIGVKIFEESKVEEISDKALLVNGHRIGCQISIRATEAFTARKWIANQQIPIYSLMIATERLPSEILTQIRNSQRATFQEACNLITYAQITGDNRLAIGGRGSRYKLFSHLSERSETDVRMHSALEKRAVKWFPQLQSVNFEYRWGGPIALTRRWQSYLNYNPITGQAAIGGYVGDGVTLSYLVAKTLAQIIDGQKTPDLPFVNQRIGRWEPEPIRYLAVNAGFKATVVADFEERITGRPSLIAAVVDPLINR